MGVCDMTVSMSQTPLDTLCVSNFLLGGNVFYDVKEVEMELPPCMGIRVLSYFQGGCYANNPWLLSRFS